MALSAKEGERKPSQVFIGKEVHTLQFRRPLFSVYDQVWELISGPDERPELDEKVVAEMVTALSLFPMRFTDWRAQLDPYVMASDASERGGGFVMARRLSERGLQASQKMLNEEEDSEWDPGDRHVLRHWRAVEGA